MKNRILVIRLGSLGDVILTSATVLNLKLHFPQSHITYFTRQRYRSIVEQFDGVDEIFTLPDTPTLKSFVRVLRELDTNNFDTVVDLHGNIRSWFTRKMVGASQVVVYPKRRWERYRAVTRKTFPDNRFHTIDMYNRTVIELHGQTPASRPVLIPPEDIDMPENIREILKSDVPTVLVAPGAAHSDKQWDLERFVKVARELEQAYDVNVVWALTADDNKKLDSMDIEIPGMSLVDYPISKLSSVISRCQVTIANDSGIMHLSSAAGTPAVAIFGPTHPVLGFSPRGLRDVVVEVDEPCRPCSLHGKKPCTRKERFCFTRITPDMVIEQVNRILETSGSTPALFVDRDGTLIVDKEYLSNPDEIELFPGVADGLKLAQESGYKIILVTNQSGVARGLFDTQTVESVNRQLLELLAASGVQIDAVYYCPHYKNGVASEYAVACDCRKPSPGMAEAAALQLGVDLRRSWVIGDSAADIGMARVIGAKAVLVRTGHGNQTEQQLGHECFGNRILIAENFFSAVQSMRNG